MGTLRLTGGTLRNRSVRAPSGRAVRPTPARVKEALFSILGPRIDGARVLDLFAGSGALGLEALSHGAAHATFVEAHRPTAEALRRTVTELALSDRATVLAQPAERVARALPGRYDIVFADPPYAQPYPAETFGDLRRRGTIDPDSLVVYEHSARSSPPDDPVFHRERTASYGQVALTFLRAEVVL
jgi:16S rRNA (guanine966-N2)-methyltransferase